MQDYPGVPGCWQRAMQEKRSLNNPESWWKRAVTAGNMSSLHAGTGKQDWAVYHTHARMRDFYQLQLVTSRSRNLHYSDVHLTICSKTHTGNASPHIVLICRLSHINKYKQSGDWGSHFFTQVNISLGRFIFEHQFQYKHTHKKSFWIFSLLLPRKKRYS